MDFKYLIAILFGFLAAVMAYVLGLALGENLYNLVLRQLLIINVEEVEK